MTGVSSLTYELLQHQDDATSRAVHDTLRGEAQFTALAKVEGASLLERDRKDAIKLREGIDLAVRRGLLTPVPPGRAFPVCKIDVHETSADDIANRILEKLPIHDTTTGLLITLQGLSGTGKGTTVKKLQKALMSQPTASGAPMRCVAWSNGNVFRAFTWLLWQRYQAQQHAKTTPNMNEIDIERSYVSPGRVDENDPTSPWTFEQFIVPEELSYCSRQLIFERRVDVRDEQECDKSTMCGFDIAMTVTNLTVPLTSPVKHIPGVPCAPSHGGTGDMGTTSSDDRSVLYVTDIAETLLKDANVSKRVPTVAEQTQGEVIQFTQHALHVLQSSGVHVILEGREETLQYITTPHRFELVQSEAETILGQRRAAQRVMALAYEHVLAETGNRKATEQKQEEVARGVLLKALNELSSSESSVDNKQSKHPVAGGSTRIQCGCC